ncbi:homoserine O-acetyltransferase MetX [Roseibacillus persicicus]|uniref:Homoserine O-acetyltransferase n=1 Tax=Roseibacillus persicicus TaxID=454148 RepID=A0A918WFV7_9BACT|nr:homoserine O-acetyltransferase [Roseibacillus persicicus]GHC47564.1 homoserine O-acetyltransferase [Roseibacillus persicicus]
MTNQTVQTQFCQLDQFQVADGSVLQAPRIAYELYGELNAEASNAILLFHALSGSHHAAGINRDIAGVSFWNEELHDGWWNDFIGPGKALDTEKFCIISPNYLGGCYGSTGPASHDPATDKPYGSSFPRVTVGDQARFAAALLDELGVARLHAVVGPSVGGLCALTFSNLFPERTQKVVSVASSYKNTILNRLLLFEQILAIENDPYFNGGDYYEGSSPKLGLALARMISHKTFVHIDAFERRAKREIVQENEMLSWYGVTDPFQSYMLYQGKKFTRRFDANTYLRIVDMWSSYNALNEAKAESAEELFAPSKREGHQFLVFSIDSDFCFYPEEQAELVADLEKAEVPVTHLTVHSDKGHDSFLLEPDLFTPQLKFHLES